MTKLYNVTVNGTTYEVQVEEIGSTAAASAPVAAPAAAPKAAPVKAEAPKAAPKAAAPVGGTPVTAPMQGTIIKVAVANGQAVKKGDLVCLLEAMKMENEIFAPCDGTVAALNVNQGASVNSGDALVTIA